PLLPLFPYTTLFRSRERVRGLRPARQRGRAHEPARAAVGAGEEWRRWVHRDEGELVHLRHPGGSPRRLPLARARLARDEADERRSEEHTSELQSLAY